VTDKSDVSSTTSTRDTLKFIMSTAGGQYSGGLPAYYYSAEKCSRHDPESKLPTLRAYLLETRSLLSLTLQVPPVPPSGMLRISLLLRLTGTVLEDIPGYSPDGTDLIPLLEWLDILDRGWLSVLCRRVWDPVRAEGVELPEVLREDVPFPTQTDCTRVHSLLIGGISTLENWLERKNEDEEDSLVHDMQRLGHQSTFDGLFHRTLVKLHDLGPGEGADEEELLVHLPSWNTENPSIYVAGMDMDRVDTGGSHEDMEETLYEHT